MKTCKDTSTKNTLCSGKSRNIVGRIPFQLFLVFGACASFSEGHNYQQNYGLSYWYPSLKQRHELKLRGGSSYNSGAIELNPEYHSYVPPSNEHEAWLQQQQQLEQQNQPSTAKPFQQTSFSMPRPRNNNASLVKRIQESLEELHQVSPSLFWTTISCVTIFILWQIPSLQRLLLQTFVCSRSNIVRTNGASLVLSAVSHESFHHLLVNLFTLFRIGPTVKQQIIPRRSMWPLLLGSAVGSNALFAAGRPKGSCMGLSGVTMALIAIQAKAFPKQVFGVVLGVFPVSLPAERILEILFLVSLAGTFVRRSRIAHLTHLGGLLCGVLYYESFILGNLRFRPNIKSK